MVDSHALVGSCAQVGKRVHISAAAQIGGVLEPIGALPVIIEDEALVGGNCGVYEGTIVGKGAVLAAGTIITGSTPVYDLVRDTVHRREGDAPLRIPEGAVVVPGLARRHQGPRQGIGNFPLHAGHHQIPRRKDRPGRQAGRVAAGKANIIRRGMKAINVRSTFCTFSRCRTGRVHSGRLGFSSAIGCGKSNSSGVEKREPSASSSQSSPGRLPRLLNRLPVLLVLDRHESTPTTSMSSMAFVINWYATPQFVQASVGPISIASSTSSQPNDPGIDQFVLVSLAKFRHNLHGAEIGADISQRHSKRRWGSLQSYRNKLRKYAITSSRFACHRPSASPSHPGRRPERNSLASHFPPAPLCRSGRHRKPRPECWPSLGSPDAGQIKGDRSWR